jgi:hypothetical protein
MCLLPFALLQEQQEALFFRCRSHLGQNVQDAFVTDVKVADLENGIQAKNPFAFDKWQSALVEPRKSNLSTENLEIV